MNTATSVRRCYVDVPFGQVHMVTTRPSVPVGRPLVLLHQTPRSWDEFAEVISILGSRRAIVAPDLPGMGGSDPHPQGPSIEAFATGVLDALDAAGVESFSLVGHHTGGVVAIEMAARSPERVGRLVLSSTPYVDAAAREIRRARPPVDHIAVQPDGGHLVELWRRRQAFYPPGRPDLLARFIRDALRSRDPAAGHEAVANYVMEDRIGAVRARTLLVGHAQDPYAYPDLDALAMALGDAERAVVEGGHVPLEFTAEQFAAIVDRFLDCESPHS